MINSENKELDISTVSARELKQINLFWNGFIIYTAAYVFSTTNWASYNLWFAIQSVGLLLCIPAAISLMRFKFDSAYLKIVYIFYCCWLFTIILRGLPFDGARIKELLFDAWYGAFLYLVPLVLLIPRKIFFLKKLFGVIVILCLLYIIYDIIFFRTLMNAEGDVFIGMTEAEFPPKTLSIPCGFLLLTYIYHSKKRNLFALAVLILIILFALVRARRGLAFMGITSLMASCLIYFYINRKKIIVVIFSLILISLFSIYAYNVFSKNSKGIFTLVAERGDEDSRTPVEEYYYADMKTKDWIIGRGINGQYFCPGVDGNGYTNYRSVIETDYLNIILKGGLISFGLLLLIVIPAILKGLFFSRNILSKAAAVWILLWLIDLYPATVTTFTLNYLLVWISAGICYSQEIRNMSDDAIKEMLTIENRDFFDILK